MSRTALPALCVVLVAALAACRSGAPPTPPSTTPETSSDRTFAILSINDVYRIEGVDAPEALQQGERGGLARVRTLRRELEARYPDLLLLHAGDLLFPSFPSRLFDGAQMISVMNLLDGDPAAFDPRMFVTFGNHEFDQDDLEDAALVDARVEESAFYWLGTNVVFGQGENGLPLVGAHNLLQTTLVESGGVRVGLFSLTIDNQHPAYVDEFTDLESTARRTVAELRGAGAEVVVALTHLDAAQDVDLLRTLGDEGPDLIVGGHDHARQELDVQGRWVLKADADAVSALVIEITVPAGGGAPRVNHRFEELGPETPEPDARVAAAASQWLELHDRMFCADLGKAPGCLGEDLGITADRLDAEELEIRRFETDLGNWITDLMHAAFDEPSELPPGADPDVPVVAFLNSGSLRLNQDIPSGPVERRHIEELFAYPSPTVLLEIDGATLRNVLERSIEGWSGGGWWLQVAGLAFRHDPQDHTVTDITLLTDAGPRPLRPDETIYAVTGSYLVDPSIGDQDGYTMLSMDQKIAEGPDLKQRVVDALGQAGTSGIDPEVQGRICNPLNPWQEDGGAPCLAVSTGR